jgi:hypothetical protein
MKIHLLKEGATSKLDLFIDGISSVEELREAVGALGLTDQLDDEGKIIESDFGSAEPSPSTFTRINDLAQGMIVRHRGLGTRYAIMGVYGDHATGIWTCDISNPTEWEIVYRPGHSA